MSPRLRPRSSLLPFDPLFAGAYRAIRADQNAQMASDTSAPIKLWFSIGKADRLMPAITAGDHASAAACALIRIKIWEKYGISLEHIGCVADRRKPGAFDILYGSYPSLRQIVVEPGLQVINDPVTILHYGCRYLDGACSHQDKFQSVTPGLYPAHSADMQSRKAWVMPKLCYEPKRDRLYRASAVSPNRRLSRNIGG